MQNSAHAACHLAAECRRS